MNQPCALRGGDGFGTTKPGFLCYRSLALHVTANEIQTYFPNPALLLSLSVGGSFQVALSGARCLRFPDGLAGGVRDDQFLDCFPGLVGGRDFGP